MGGELSVQYWFEWKSELASEWKGSTGNAEKLWRRLSTASRGKRMPTNSREGKTFRMQYPQQQSSQELTTRQWQHLALNDDTLDTYPKIMDAVRSLV